MNGPAPHSAWRMGLWILSAALAISLHAGAIALALRTTVSPPVDDDDGVLMLELAPIAAAAPTGEQPLPPGPLSTESVDSAAAASQQSEVKPSVETDQPPLPILADPPPEAVLPVYDSKPRTEEPDPERPLDAQQAVAASAASVASVAAAPPTTPEAPSAQKPAAPNPGQSQRDKNVRTRWEGALSGHLARFGRFPDGVRGLKEERIVTVRFRLDRNGQVMATEVATSSGSQPLDLEALAMIRRASPLPVPPAQVLGDLVELVVPVRFKVRR